MNIVFTNFYNTGPKTLMSSSPEHFTQKLCHRSIWPTKNALLHMRLWLLSTFTKYVLNKKTFYFQLTPSKLEIL